MHITSKRCPICRHQFPGDGRTVYCSDPCRIEARRRNVREYAALHAGARKARKVEKVGRLTLQVDVLASMDMDAREISELVGVSLRTVHAWQTQAQPMPVAVRRLLILMRDHPELVDEIRNA